MKKRLALLLLLISQLSNANWILDFEEGQKMAIENSKLMVVVFSASWCAPCKEMES